MKNRMLKKGAWKNPGRMVLLALAALGGAMLLLAFHHAAATADAADAGNAATGAPYTVGLDSPTKFPTDI
ncbi:MAG: hypothetical protein OD817_04250 [Gammaproteobacteria bacterium]